MRKKWDSEYWKATRRSTDDRWEQVRINSKIQGDLQDSRKMPSGCHFPTPWTVMGNKVKRKRRNCFHNRSGTFGLHHILLEYKETLLKYLFIPPHPTTPILTVQDRTYNWFKSLLAQLPAMSCFNPIHLNHGMLVWEADSDQRGCAPSWMHHDVAVTDPPKSKSEETHLVQMSEFPAHSQSCSNSQS